VKGTISDTSVLVQGEKDISTLRNRGYKGTLTEDGLRLSLVEAAYLLENGKIDLGMEFSEFMIHCHSRLRFFEVAYMVYRNIRDRGYFVDVSVDGRHPVFDLYAKGSNIFRARPVIRVLPMAENVTFSVSDIVGVIETNRSRGRRTVVGLLDEDGDPTYYEVKLARISGRWHAGELPPMEGIMLEDRILVESTDPSLPEVHGFGKNVGGTCYLSLVEAGYLMRRGRLRVYDPSGRRLRPSEFTRKARQIQRDFTQRMAVYSRLRDMGLIPKTGFKYGAHFRAYEKGMDDEHARYLVHVLPKDFKGKWQDVSRAVRIAHAVRKDLILSCGIRPPVFLGIRRVKL